ncbi:alpha/beta hydrolase [Streptomyces sp. NPDC021224]|uniref:alpha/beta hydrolase n=1 Tax=unclassified Streptomyces TaxID=2593676 RepID=UPI0037A02678
MASQALPARGARLGHPVAPGLVPAPRWGHRAGRGPRGGEGTDGGATGATVRAVVLALPGGDALSTRRRSPLAAAVIRPLARHLVREGAAEGVAAHVVHYRFRGWNGGHAHPAEDAEWAVSEAVRRYGDVPVCLVGMGMGARAALHAAAHPAVGSVVALSPWLPDDPEPEPVKQLAGRRVLLVHGTQDESTDPDLSLRFAERAKKINREVCRFEVHSDGHSLHQHRSEVFALATDFVLGSLLDRPYARPVADALAAPPPLGLRMPLASGFGRALRA